MTVPRCSSEDVQNLTGYKDDCTVFTKQADLLVTEELAPSGDSAGKVSSERLALISLYLACHFAAIKNQDVAKGQNRIGESDERYHNVYDGGLSMTTWGQQACVFDTSGTLTAMSAKAVSGKLPAKFTVIDPVSSPVFPFG